MPISGSSRPCSASTPGLVTTWTGVARFGVPQAGGRVASPMLPAGTAGCRLGGSRMRPSIELDAIAPLRRQGARRRKLGRPRKHSPDKACLSLLGPTSRGRRLALPGERSQQAGRPPLLKKGTGRSRADLRPVSAGRPISSAAQGVAAAQPRSGCSDQVRALFGTRTLPRRASRSPRMPARVGSERQRSMVPSRVLTY
jgi:hypothetical protein